MKKIRLVFICLFAVSKLAAQFQFVPSGASSVVSLNLSTLANKMDLKHMANDTRLKPADSVHSSYALRNELLKRIVGNLDESGVDLTKSVVNCSWKDSHRAGMFIIPLKSEKKMEQVVKKLLSQVADTDLQLIRSKDKKGIYYIDAHNEIGIGLMGDMCIIMNVHGYYFYEDNYFELNRATDSIRAIIGKVRGLDNPGQTPDDYVPSPPPREDNEEGVEDGESTDSTMAPAPYDEGTYYDYESDSIMIAFRKWWNEQAKVREKKWWSKVDQVYRNYMTMTAGLGKSGKGLLATDADFKLKSSKSADLFQWFNFDEAWHEITKEAQRHRYYNEENERVRYRDSTPYEQTPLGKFLGRLTLAGYGNFDMGSASLKYEISLSDSMKKYYDQAFGGSVNRDLFSMIKVPAVASLSASNINLGKCAEWWMAALQQFSNTFYQGAPANSRDFEWQRASFLAQEIIYGLLDKDVLQNTFTGSTVSAVTGLMKIKQEYRSWEYDDEGNYKPVTKYRESEIPKVVNIMELGKQANVDKLLNPFIRNHFLVKQGNAYVINGAHLEFPFYIIRTPKYLIFTTDSMYREPDFINLPGMLDPALIDRASSKALFWEVDGVTFKNLFLQYSDMGQSSRDKTLRLIEAVNRISAHANTNGNNDLTFTIDFSNKNQCSLLNVIEMMDLFDRI